MRLASLDSSNLSVSRFHFQQPAFGHGLGLLQHGFLFKQNIMQFSGVADITNCQGGKGPVIGASDFDADFYRCFLVCFGESESSTGRLCWRESRRDIISVLYITCLSRHSSGINASTFKNKLFPLSIR